MRLWRGRLGPETQQVFGAMQDNQATIDRFTGAVPIPEFFDPEIIGRIIGKARPDAA